MYNAVFSTAFELRGADLQGFFMCRRKKLLKKFGDWGNLLFKKIHVLLLT
jgi:hypothetical protein